ncbi:Amino acid ABC transporter periplasmic protein [Chromobacterium vaccinii]|nr:Amino acid ABC transporter periplasmic protein [Chromobacterium vaccinii]QND89505.1 Amino acid ABC transporter periplasmic protein [Chromobacterium vaccinii]
MLGIGRVIWLVVWTLPAVAEGICGRPLSIGWDEWPPFHYQGRSGEPDGYAVQLLNLAAGRLGCRLTYRLMPWPRTLQQLRLGQVDAAMQALRTPEREAYACFAPGYSPTIVRLWARSDKAARWPVRQLDDLGRQGEVLLGVTRGDSYGAQLDRWLQTPPSNVHVEVSETLAVSMRKLQLGRTNLLLATMATATRELARLPQKPEIAPLEPSWRAGEGYYVFSRKSVPEPVCQAFARALAEMRQDGTVARLYRSQFGVPYPEP